MALAEGLIPSVSGKIVPRDQEPAELLLALGVFLVITLAFTQKVADKTREE